MIRILAATAAALLGTSASAHEPSVIVDGVPTAHVSYADLNLRSSAGRSHMARRIRSAAENLCKGGFVETTVTGPATNECYRVAVLSGITQMNVIARL